jgi:hypothetical protein
MCDCSSIHLQKIFFLTDIEQVLKEKKLFILR